MSGDRLTENGEKSLSWKPLNTGRKGGGWVIILLGGGKAVGKGAPTCEGDTPPSGDAREWSCTRTDEQQTILLGSPNIKGTCSDWGSQGTLLLVTLS